MEHGTYIALCLGTWIRPESALNSLVRWGHRFCSADGGSHGLCSPCECHCTWGHVLAPAVLGCAASRHALARSSGRTGWRLYSVMSGTRLQVFSSGAVGEAALKPIKIFACCLNSNSSQPTLQVSGLNRATVFAQQTISSAHPALGSSAADCRHCLQPFWLEGARRHSPPQVGL